MFASLGFEGEGAWWAAAGVRMMLHGARGLRTRGFWMDADARWLAGVSASGGVTYVNKERFEELVCRLELPALVAVAGGEGMETLTGLEARVGGVCTAMVEAGFNLDRWLDGAPPAGATLPAEPAAGMKAGVGGAAAKKAAVKLAAKPQGAAEAKIEKGHRHGGVRAALVAKEEAEEAAVAPVKTAAKAVVKAVAAKASGKTAAKAAPVKAVKLAAAPKGSAEAKIEKEGKHTGGASGFGG